MPSWDNTARCRNKSSVWINSSPESYNDWLSQAISFVRKNRSHDDRFVFINAWNEWAEGCHLEPDQRFGYAWLNATKLALQEEPAEAALDYHKADAFELSDPVRGAVSSNGSSYGSVPPESDLIPGFKTHRPLNILFVSHDAHPMGAQKLLLTLTSWLKENELVNPRFVLAGPGALTEEFLRIGPVLNWDADRLDNANPDIAHRLLRSFCGKDLSAVYLNSAASGHLIEFTRHFSVPQIAHVHELEKSIERWVGTKKMSDLRSYAHLLIAASSPVAENLHERHGIS